MIERAAEAPLYKQIAAELRARIKGGTFTVGDQIPSEAEMQDQYGVSRMTARLAVQELRTEGLVVTGQGKGTFVADPKTAPMPYLASVIHSASARAQRPGRDAFSAELESAGRTGEEHIQVERRGAPDAIADRLGLSPGDPVILRRRLQVVEGHPSALVDSWWPADIAEGTELASPASVARGTDTVMAELGLEALTRRDEVTARMPTPEEAQELGIAGGVPVVIVVATELASEGQPVEVYTRVHPADRFVLVYEVAKADR